MKHILKILKYVLLPFLLLSVVIACTNKKGDDIQYREILYRLLEKTATESTVKIGSFLFLTPYCIGVIGETNIAINVPNGTTVAALVASFSHNGLKLTVNGTEQTSGTTINDFTNPVTYVLTGSDGSIKNYIVTVIIGQ